MSHEELPYEELPEAPDWPPLPIGEIVAAVYRHIWRYRWPYLGQIVFWTLMMWLRQYPVLILSDVLEWAGVAWFVGDANLVTWLLAVVTKLLFLALGGGLIFLSCGCAILFDRHPRAGDALQLPPVKAFWIASFRFWILADLLLVLVVRGLYLCTLYLPDAASWMNPFAWQIGFLVYPVVIWALMGLALPLAAFDRTAMPFHEAWRRLRAIGPTILLLFAIVAAPIVLPQAMKLLAPLAMGITGLLSMFALIDAFPLLITAMFLASIFLSFLLILVLSATTVEVYKRLASDSAELAKTFD
jgi:hypothetical protein